MSIPTISIQINKASAQILIVNQIIINPQIKNPNLYMPQTQTFKHKQTNYLKINNLQKS